MVEVICKTKLGRLRELNNAADKERLFSKEEQCLAYNLPLFVWKVFES